MTLDHPELGSVPTYGGPYDSYTIPAPEGEPTDPWHERELRSERYDHDAGWWVEGGEPVPLRIVHEDVLFKLQEDAESPGQRPTLADPLRAALLKCIAVIEQTAHCNGADRLVAAEEVRQALAAQAADSVLEDAARWTTEREHAIRQGHEIAASDGYFEARPQIDSNDRRKVFQAGFERGWDAAMAANGGNK